MTFKDLLEDEREEGRKEGRAEGRVEGLLTKAREMAKAMLSKKLPIAMIAEISGLSESEIKSL